MPRKEHKTTARVESGVVYLVDADSFAINDLQRWQRWLLDAQSFYYVSQAGTFTARKEKRRNTHYWYAYRRHYKRLVNVYIGTSDKLTREHMDTIAYQLADKIEAHEE